VIGHSDQLGLANRFTVEVGGCNLGSWSKVDGLTIDFNPEQRESGGEYDRIYWLPSKGSVKWGKVTLTRAMTAKDSGQLRSWLSKKLGELLDPGGNLAYEDGDAVITLFDAHGAKVIHWELRGVHVQQWKGPTFDASAGKIALESLTLVHEGFL